MAESPSGERDPAGPMLDALVFDGAWWDHVDRIAPAGHGHLPRSPPPPAGALMRASARDANIRRRRAALPCQLGFKENTDPVLLYDCLPPRLDHDELCVRKAMGRAHRACARTDPDRARRCVAENERRLAKLTRREALEHIG